MQTYALTAVFNFLSWKKDIVNAMNDMRIESKVHIERDSMTNAPRVQLIFRFLEDGNLKSTYLNTLIHSYYS